jgi:hypothetical protein
MVDTPRLSIQAHASKDSRHDAPTDIVAHPVAPSGTIGNLHPSVAGYAAMG